MFDYDNMSKKTFLNLQILHFLSKEFCQSRLRDPSKVSLDSLRFIEFSNYKKKNGINILCF